MQLSDRWLEVWTIGDLSDFLKFTEMNRKKTSGNESTENHTLSGDEIARF